MSEAPRLQYHFEPEKGWMNDPNGLCYFRGKYHAYFQHNPHSPRWDVMHWGHAVSEDLIHWEERDIVMYPDMPYENFLGCFSGSAMEKDGTLYLMYTAVSREQGQTQCIATTTDGDRFEKYSGNPVIAHSPVDPSNRDFRDPKVIPWGDEYRMVCGTGVDGLARVLLYRSADLLHWDCMGPIFESRDFGPVTECPDLFPLGDKWVLTFSRMDDSHACQFVVGKFDGEHFIPESFQLPEIGPHNYATQTFTDPKGRRIAISWMSPWDREIRDDDVRTGAFAIPRELSLRDGKVLCAPIEEAQHLLVEDDRCVVRENGVLRVVNGGQVLLELSEDQVHDVKILPDTRTREVFLNGGETVVTFWMKER